MKTKKLFMAWLIEVGCAIALGVFLQVYAISRIFSAVANKQTLEIQSGQINSFWIPYLVPISMLLYLLNLIALIAFIVYFFKVRKIQKSTQQKFFEVIDNTPKFKTIFDTIFIYAIIYISINIIVSVVRALTMFR